jgi:hypothetical protein
MVNGNVNYELRITNYHISKLSNYQIHNSPLISSILCSKFFFHIHPCLNLVPVTKLYFLQFALVIPGNIFPLVSYGKLMVIQLDQGPVYHTAGMWTYKWVFFVMVKFPAMEGCLLQGWDGKAEQLLLNVMIQQAAVNE